MLDSRCIFLTKSVGAQENDRLAAWFLGSGDAQIVEQTGGLCLSDRCRAVRRTVRARYSVVEKVTMSDERRPGDGVGLLPAAELFVVGGAGQCRRFVG